MGPENFAADPEQECAYRAAIEAGDVRRISSLLQELQGSMRFWNRHAGKRRAIAACPEFWERAFKFTIERHSYGRRYRWPISSRDRPARRRPPLAELLQIAVELRPLSNLELSVTKDRSWSIVSSDMSGCAKICARSRHRLAAGSTIACRGPRAAIATTGAPPATSCRPRRRMRSTSCAARSSSFSATADSPAADRIRSGSARGPYGASHSG